MSVGKADKPSGVTSDLLQVCKNDSGKKLPAVAVDLLQEKKMPESWGERDLIPVNKIKGDVRSYGNYRSVTLLEHSMKEIEIVFEKRLRNLVKLNEMQMGFMIKRETVDASYTLQQMLERYEMAGRKLYLLIWKKAFHHVPR